MQDSNSLKWTAELGGHGIGPNSVIYYLFDPPATLHPCSVGQCVEKFRWNEIHEHLITKHRGISNYPDVTCNVCHRTIKARSYKEHFLELHSGRRFCCAYCNGTLSRVRNFPDHFGRCPGLTQRVCYIGFWLNEEDWNVGRTLNTNRDTLAYIELLPISFLSVERDTCYPPLSRLYYLYCTPFLRTLSFIWILYFIMQYMCIQ